MGGWGPIVVALVVVAMDLVGNQKRVYRDSRNDNSASWDAPMAAVV